MRQGPDSTGLIQAHGQVLAADIGLLTNRAIASRHTHTAVADLAAAALHARLVSATVGRAGLVLIHRRTARGPRRAYGASGNATCVLAGRVGLRSEEHTSE